MATAQAATIENTVTGSVNGYALDLSQATVTLDIEDGPAATTLVAEISPNFVAANVPAQVFAYDMLAGIGPDDTGIDHLALTAPAGYGNLTLNALSVAGTPWSQVCPAPGSQQYCATGNGRELTVVLGGKITADRSRISLDIEVDAPAQSGITVFTSRVDDLATPGVPALEAVDGDADGDADDDNHRQVIVYANADPSVSTVVVEPDIVIADGVSSSSVAVTLLDTQRRPVPTKQVALATDRGTLDTIDQPAGLTGSDGLAVGAVRSLAPGVATVTATDVTDGYPLTAEPVIYFTQGEVLRLAKWANKDDVVVGDVVTYRIEIRNTADTQVEQVKLIDRIPPNFKYLSGSTRFNGAPADDPAGVRQLAFAVGNVAALVDSNGNGQADVGEAGYQTLSYQLVVGSGAQPGDYVNTAHAIDVCDRCLISNRAEASVEVVLDPLFDLGTIVGKVFDDRDGDGRQSQGEAGIGGAMVALDNGSYVLTDEYGRYHFPAVAPGHRLLKVNLRHLADNAVATTEEARVVAVTPGLLVKANFGITYQFDRQRIGRPGVKGVRLHGEGTEKPLQVQGNVRMMLAVINGNLDALPMADVQLGAQALEDTVDIRGGELTRPAVFRVDLRGGGEARAWRLVIDDMAGNRARTLSGDGPTPATVEWDGRDEAGRLVDGGRIYQYQMVLDYSNGSRLKTARQLFGVNRSEVLSVNMSGGAFKSGSFELTDAAQRILAEAAEVLKQFPHEQVVVEGHSDSLGAAEFNEALSRHRAEAAVRYLVEAQGVSREQLLVRALGETRPMVGNDTEYGRELNRRVEVKGNFNAQADARLYDQYRTEPGVTVNGEALPLDSRGSFKHSMAAEALDQVELTLANSRGAELRAMLELPSLALTSLAAMQQFAYGSHGDGFAVHEPPAAHGWPHGADVMRFDLRGRTDPGNRIEIDGEPVAVSEDGAFSHPLALQLGERHVAIMAINARGYSRIADVHLALSDRDDDGSVLLLVKPIPDLTVKLPQTGVVRHTSELPVSGVTDPANRVTVNGEPVAVNPDGRFTATLTLPPGRSSVRIEATDPQGFRGVIEREIEVSDNRLFFMAFADGKVGQLAGEGYLEGAGMTASSEFYSEGRLAYYLKGVIKGKYLITSRFDSGADDVTELLEGLDERETSKLFTHLDPDKYYPVYGDASTLVHDTESQGRFYLAVASDELDAVVGNYGVSLDDTELAAYQRTLHGARVAYESLASRMSGRPDTRVIVFGAQVRQTPVHDELRATGGSLYYLSHGDIIEGSEQVTVVVRDKTTGLTLSRTPLRQAIDYRIYYDRGRLLLSEPLASVAGDHSLVDDALLAGHPVFVVVDYETELGSLEKTAFGGRVSKTLNEHIAVGATYLSDDLDTGQYTLSAVDGEIRLGQGLRLLAEAADSSGADGNTFYSDDGGLSFDNVTPDGTSRGQAWKAAMELDAGKLLFNAYMKQLGEGFVSGGNFLELGTLKAGVGMRYALGDRSRLTVRYDSEEHDGATADTNAIARTANLSLQWRYDAQRWGVSTEYQSRERVDVDGNVADSSGYAAGELRYQVSDHLAARVERQQTVTGTPNDQTTVGADYEMGPATTVSGSISEGTQGQAAQAGVQWLFGGGKLYLDERLARDSAGQSSLGTVIGAERALGRRSRIYSEYQIENADSGDRQVSLLGLDRHWDMWQGLRLTLAGEHSQVTGETADNSRYVLAVGLGYKGLSGLNWSTRNEIRRDLGDTERMQYLTRNLLELKLHPDYTLLLNYVLSETRDLDADVREAAFNEHSIGLAYRPVATDRLNLLARYTGVADRRPLNLDEMDAEQTELDVFSIEWSYALNRRWEWVEKQAFKRKTEESGGRAPFTTHTRLSLHRLNYQMARRWDVGMEYRSLSQREAEDRRDGWLGEVMWRANKHVRLGVGFNFTDFSDNEFSENDYSVYGWFFRLQGKY